MPPSKATARKATQGEATPDRDDTQASIQRAAEEEDQALDAGDGRPDPHPPVPDEAELDAKEREIRLRERELALAAREQELATREAAVAAGTPAAVPAGPPPLPEFVVVLANGETVEAPNPAATHHAGADGQVYPVVRAYPIEGKYGVPVDKHPDNPDRRRY